jgi:hypothetical protein
MMGPGALPPVLSRLEAPIASAASSCSSTWSGAGEIDVDSVTRPLPGQVSKAELGGRRSGRELVLEPKLFPNPRDLGGWLTMAAGPLGAVFDTAH